MRHTGAQFFDVEDSFLTLSATGFRVESVREARLGPAPFTAADERRTHIPRMLFGIGSKG